MGLAPVVQTELQAPLQIEALYTSGSRSIHALVRVDARTYEEWHQKKKDLMPFLVAGSILTGGLGAAAVVLVGAIAAVTLIIVVGAGLASYQYAVWTLLFLKLHTRGHGGTAKLVRWFRRLLA